MGQPNLGPDKALLARIVKLENQVKALSTRDVLANSSIDHGGMTVTGGGSITVRGGGNVIVGDSGSVEVTGTGKVTVDGLTLSAVTASAASGGTSGWALTTTATTVGSASVAVPTGFTTAIVWFSAKAGAFLSGNSAADYFYISGEATAPGAGAIPWNAGAVACQGDTGTLPSAGSDYPVSNYTQVALFSGVTAGSITVTLDVHAQGNTWPAESSNGAAIDMVAIFLP